MTTGWGDPHQPVSYSLSDCPCGLETERGQLTGCFRKLSFHTQRKHNIPYFFLEAPNCINWGPVHIFLLSLYQEVANLTEGSCRDNSSGTWAYKGTVPCTRSHLCALCYWSLNRDFFKMTTIAGWMCRFNILGSGGRLYRFQTSASPSTTSWSCACHRRGSSACRPGGRPPSPALRHWQLTRSWLCLYCSPVGYGLWLQRLAGLSASACCAPVWPSYFLWIPAKRRQYKHK